MNELLKKSEKIDVLFVCMGNICRSPAAEIIFRHFVNRAGLEHKIRIDSAGTIGFHEGNKPDARMGEALAKRGYADPNIRARKIKKEDLERFDIILTMDHANLADVNSLDQGNKFSEKIKSMCTFITKYGDTEIPDPYYGGSAGFEHVIDLLEDGCKNLLEKLVANLEH